MLIDITRPLSAETAVWPGDLATEVRRVATLAAGSLVNCHELHVSLHAATHLDAPYHYDNAGQTIDTLDLGRLVGPCTVLRLPAPCPRRMTPTTLETALAGGTLYPRLLLATDGWPDSRVFPETFPTLTEEAVTWLAERGVRLLGVDVPSVDCYPAATIPIHLALHARDIWILESLELSRALAGVYELMALPLNIPGAEASPVRAVLRPLT